MYYHVVSGCIEGTDVERKLGITPSTLDLGAQKPHILTLKWDWDGVSPELSHHIV